MAKTPYRRHRLFWIVEEKKTHGKKRVRYGFRPQVGVRWNAEEKCMVFDNWWVSNGQANTADLQDACWRSGYDILAMVRPGFRFKNRSQAGQFYTMITLMIGT